MRKRFILFFCVLGLALPGAATGQLQINPYLINQQRQFDPCLGKYQTLIGKNVPESSLSAMFSKQLVCFKINDYPVSLTQPLTISVDHPLTVKGLWINGQIVITSISPVTLVNSTIKGSVVIKGKVTNGHHTLSGGSITCPDKTTDGLTIASDGTVVTGMEIEGCKTGVVINADSTRLGPSSPEKYEALKNKIHDNAFGIEVAQGKMRNTFAYNDIHGNYLDPTNRTGNADNAILLRFNDEIMDLRPIPKSNDSGKFVRCIRDPDSGDILERHILFDVGGAEGTMSVYQADEPQQALHFLADCPMRQDGICVLKEADLQKQNVPSTCEIGQTKQEFMLQALFTSNDQAPIPSSSSPLADKYFGLDGIASVPSVPVNVPGGTTGVTEGGTISTGDIGNVALYDPSLEEGSDPEGAAGMSSSGGMAPAGCGASLVPDTSPPIVIWLSLPLFPISYLLLRRKLLHRR